MKFMLKYGLRKRFWWVISLTEKFLNPKEIFNTAEVFSRAADLINKEMQTNKDFSLMAPFVVNRAFSLELYLKCLIVLEKGFIPKDKKVHGLKDLYGLISAKSKQVIKSNYNKLVANDITLKIAHREKNIDLDLSTVLNKISSAFVKWRYIYEKNFTDFYSVKTIAISIKKRIFELKPEWFDD